MKFNFSPTAIEYNRFLINGLKTNKLFVVIWCSLSLAAYISVPYLEKYQKNLKIKHSS